MQGASDVADVGVQRVQRSDDSKRMHLQMDRCTHKSFVLKQLATHISAHGSFVLEVAM